MKLGKIFELKEESSEGEINEMVSEIQEMLKKAKNKNEIVKLLTMAPKIWGSRKLSKYFEVSYNIARKAFDLRKTKGPGSSPNPSKSTMTLPLKTVNLVNDFYHAKYISRVLTGKKYFISYVKDANRIHVQKRLLLGNIKELYALFQKDYPDCQISLSKFTELRPKECVLAGSNGTHSVCVCKTHKNVKLMIDDSTLGELTKIYTETSFLSSYKTIFFK